jgi:hypothetical protein
MPSNKSSFVVDIDETLKDTALTANVFDAAGNLLATAPVGKNGKVELDIDPSVLAQSQLFITPTRPNAATANLTTRPTLTTMRMADAVQPTLRLTNDKLTAITGISADKLQLWRWIRCNVRGRLTKKVWVENQWKEFGVCKTRVHICEVDRIPRLILDLPDDIIWKWRYEWWKLLKPQVRPPFPIPVEIKRPPIPEPDPAPFQGPAIDPAIVRSPLDNVSELLRSSSISPKLNVGDAFNFSNAHLNLTLPRIKLPVSPVQFPTDVETTMLSGNISAIKANLVKNIELFRPWFCIWKWLWPYILRMDEMATVMTDEFGNFEAPIYYLPTGDKPDVYIWAEYNIDGSWVSIYKPNIACNTIWDYVCNSEIKINITDPRVVPCGIAPSQPGSGIEFRRIGSGCMPHMIKQANSSPIPVIQGRQFKDIGLTNCRPEFGNRYVSPFGGTLGLKIIFTDGLRAANITHYRWKFRTIALDNPSGNHTAAGDNTLNFLATPGAWQFINSDVSVGYVEFNSSPIQFFHKRFKLGPVAESTEPMYLIPPSRIEDLPLPAPAAGISRFWENEEFYSAALDTINNCPEGLYELQLELFEKQGANVFVKREMNKDQFQVPDEANTNQSKNAPDVLLQQSAAGKAFGFKVLVRVDNRACEAALYPVTVNGTAVTTDCGFMAFNTPDANVKVDFSAVHPADFAFFSFNIDRAYTSALTLPDVGGQMVIGNAPYTIGLDSRLYTLVEGSPNVYTQNFNASQLMGACPAAAFVESVVVAATATDGTNRLYYLDRRDDAAFALQKQ